jgi:hypothetical protein
VTERRPPVGASNRFARVTLVAALAASPACAHEAPLTPEMQARGDQAARIGALIFAHETARARASQALRAAAPGLPSSGSITRMTPDGGAVTSFVDGGADPPRIAYEAVAGPDGKLAVTRVAPPRPLDADEVAILRAQATARREVHVLCGDAYDPVVLPGALLGKDGWLVYLLATFQKPGTRVLAGHQLVRVSADGSTALEQASLAQTCVVADDSMHPGDVVRLPRTTGDAPTEADYYIALAYGVRLDLVFDDGRVWKVNPR